MGHSFDLGDRLTEFALLIGGVVRRLPSDRVAGHVACQLVRSGMAPAAHHAEARGAESRRDFIHKMRLGLKELRESQVWLRLAARLDETHGTDVQAVARECGELIGIFVKSIKTARTNLLKTEHLRSSKTAGVRSRIPSTSDV